jgi:hypothetical protein
MPPLPYLSLRSILGLAVVVIVAYLTALGFQPQGARGATHRWLEDRHDRGIYFQRSQWYPRRELPYRDVFSEYPTVATLAFAAPHVLPGSVPLKAGSYRLRWSMLMAAVLLGTIALIAAFRRSVGARGEVALLLLLPSTLYFSLMRFDILCVSLVCASLWAFRKGRYVVAHVVLAVATHTKWYPAVLFPVYFAYHLANGPASWRPRELLRSPAVRYGGVYVLTAGAITLASILAFTWHGFLVPYRFHAGRGGQFINLYVLAEQARGALGIGRHGRGLMNLAFGCLQLSIVPILFLKPVRTMTGVFRMAVLAIFLFIAFARIDSPQWLLWYVAPVLMFARRPATLCVASALAIWSYLVFPIGYDAYARKLDAAGFSTIVLVKDALAVLLVALVFRESVPEARAARGHASPTPSRRG